jgi:deoxycytidylate deaminase
MSDSNSDLLVDILHPSVPQLPAPLDSEDLHWLIIARQYAIRSVDPLNRSGCVIVRAGRILTAACDSFPGAMRSTMARRRHRHTRENMLLSAEQTAVALAAATGVSLQNTCAYIWPMFTSALSAALLIESGCVVLTVPDFQTPSRLEGDLRLIREMAAETGVLLHAVDPSALPGGDDA